MGSDHIGQGLLEDVGLWGVAQQCIDVHRTGGLHATDAGALSVGHLGRVHPTQQLGGRDARGDEGIDGGHEIPRSEAVDRLGHRAQTPDLRVESLGHLSADETGQLEAPGHPDQTALESGHQEAVLDCFDLGALWVFGDERLGFVLAAHEEGGVFFAVDRHHQRGGAVDQRAFVMEAADAKPSLDLLTETIDDLSLSEGLTRLGVGPRWGGLGLVDDPPGGPCQLDDASGAEPVFDLKLQPGPTGADRADLACGHDAHHFFEWLADFSPRLGRLAESPASRVGEGQELVIALGRVIGLRLCGSGSGKITGQLAEIEIGLVKPTG